ncbi:MAG: hypothetical protein C6Y22_00320 [Hapalosiphonaceae cyanobacterium JJU2]|nr:MAG: hypothetical protein C6Y22_00320 [Hapalosiphonaceae cyanobacterium JJU2]
MNRVSTLLPTLPDAMNRVSTLLPTFPQHRRINITSAQTFGELSHAISGWSDRNFRFSPCISSSRRNGQNC